MATANSVPSRPIPSSASFLWPLLILTLFSLVAYAASWQNLPTADEPKFLQVGRYLTTRWDWEPASTTVHAPLSFYTHGLLLKPFTFADDATRLRAARATMLLYAWGLGLAVYVWSRTAHGPRAGLLALGLWAALPDTLAHAPLITTDIILACWVVWLGFALWRWSATGRWRWTLAGGGALGLALLSKYSAALWLPGIAVLGLALAFLKRPADAPPPRRILGGVAMVLFIGYTVLCLGYGGRGMFDSWGEHHWASARFGQLEGHPVFARFPLLAPLPWLRGIDFAGANAHLGHPGFLLGRKFLHAPWYYQPVSFLLKVPTPFLALLALAPLAARRAARPDWRGTACLLAPPLSLAVYLMFFNRIAGGFRYIYPLLPALCIVLGRYASPDARMLPKVRSGVCTCVVLCVVTALWHFPHFIAYANLFGGGPQKAYRLFADSTLDWGQTPAPALDDRPDVLPIINPGPVPVAGTLLVNVNTYHDVFSRGDPHAWLRTLPVRRVHGGVWIELDGSRAVDDAPAILLAMGAGDVRSVEDLLENTAPDLPLRTRITAHQWLALAYVEAGRAAEARAASWQARALELAETYGLDPDVAYGQCLEAARTDPGDPVARNNAGVAAYLEGLFTEAAEHFAAAIRLQPFMPAPYANLAGAEAARGHWAAAVERQRTFNTLAATSVARAFHPYRVYYGEQRVMLGNVLELWPRYTVAQLEAEVAWRARPAPATGAARIRAYAAKRRLVEAGLALAELESLTPADPTVVRLRDEWKAAVDAMRRAGHVSG